MKHQRLLTILACLLCVAPCFAQSWRTAYEAGIAAARSSKWDEARADFKKAAANRPEDVAGPTLLPGPPTADRRWRNGSPYSPNFLAAYSGYRQALLSKDPDAQKALTASVETEFEGLLARKQLSRETYFVLSFIYSRGAETDKLKALQDKYGSQVWSATWRVDTEIVAPEELAAIASAAPGTVGSPASPAGTSLPAMLVQKVAVKYALVIGIRSPRLPGSLSYAVDDAVRVRDTIVGVSGYPAANVELVADGTAAQIMEHARALANRVPDGATIMLYFTGVGVNMGGRDYLAGSDTTSVADMTTMVAKSDLYSVFLPKSAHVFAFFQVDRSGPVNQAFGIETPYLGAIAQMQATLPGDPVFAAYRNGRQIGLYTEAFAETMEDLQSNQLPILEFAWQLFYRMRRGNTGITGGSSRQTCTLPYLNNLASDAKF